MDLLLPKVIILPGDVVGGKTGTWQKHDEDDEESDTYRFHIHVRMIWFGCCSLSCGLPEIRDEGISILLDG
jgi:hypothetical protein